MGSQGDPSVSASHQIVRSQRLQRFVGWFTFGVAITVLSRPQTTPMWLLGVGLLVSGAWRLAARRADVPNPEGDG